MVMIFLIGLFFFIDMYGMTIGSDTAPTRFNNQVTLNNGDRIAGFAALDGGFFINGPNVTATFDSFFQVSGSLEFNGGTLSLSQDLSIANVSCLGPLGSIEGNFHDVDLSRTVTALPIASTLNACTIFFETEINGVSPFETVDWAFDNVYIAVGSTANPELLVYEFDGSALTLVDSVGPPGSTRPINAVRWRPGEYFLAMARNAGNNAELFIYEFDTGTQTLTQIDSQGHGGAGRAVSWYPDGTFLVEGTTGNAQEVKLYSVDAAGNLGAPVNINIAPNRDVQPESLDFNDTGEYFAVGLNTSGANPTVLVYAFTPIPLGAALNASTLTAATVGGISWNKVETDLIAVGQAGTTGDRVIVYEHNAGAGTLTQVASISDFSAAVENVTWDATGQCLAVGTSVAAGVGQVRTYCFDATSFIFTLISSFDRANNVGGLSWSVSNSLLAVSDDASVLSVYNRATMDEGAFVLSDLTMVLNNNVVMDNAALIFSGLTTIEGQGNTLDLMGTSTLVIDADSSLNLKNIHVIGAGAQNISGTDMTSTLTCEDVVWSLDSDFTFTQGQLAIVSELLLQGDQKQFTYRTDGGAVVDSFSRFVVDMGVTFSYDPLVQDKNLLQFCDNTSQLVLTGGTVHASTVGLNLTKGTLVVDRASTITSAALSDSEAISFGDGLSASNNFDIEVHPAATLEILNGRVLFKNA